MLGEIPAEQVRDAVDMAAREALAERGAAAGGCGGVSPAVGYGRVAG